MNKDVHIFIQDEINFCCRVSLASELKKVTVDWLLYEINHLLE